jgi:hypothetical protein
MKSRMRRVRRFYFMIIFLFIVIIWISGIVWVAAAPELTRPSVTPRDGTPDDKFMFLVTYKDLENRAPEFIQLIIDDDRYELAPLNELDKNYSDGKDYIVKLKIPEGTHLYYFEASNGNQTTSSLATPLVVKAENEFTHLDVAYSILFATFIILIPIVYGLHQLRKLANNLDRLANKGEKPKRKTQRDNTRDK